MQKKLWIGLENIEFHAYHGWYEEEQQVGGKYVVDIAVQTNAQGAELYDDLEGTLDYEIIYYIVKKNMQHPVKLIEHLARSIVADLREIIAEDDTIKLKIRKLHPPLGGKVGASMVEIED